MGTFDHYQNEINNSVKKALREMSDDELKEILHKEKNYISVTGSSSKGWICPVCGRGLSPFTTFCPCRGYPEWKITC